MQREPYQPIPLATLLLQASQDVKAKPTSKLMISVFQHIQTIEQHHQELNHLVRGQYGRSLLYKQPHLVSNAKQQVYESI